MSSKQLARVNNGSHWYFDHPLDHGRPIPVAIKCPNCNGKLDSIEVSRDTPALVLTRRCRRKGGCGLFRVHIRHAKVAKIVPWER